MALRRKGKRNRNKLDATVPEWQEEQRAPTDAPATTGPWDAAEAPDDGAERLDLGALRVPTPQGYDLRVDMNQQGAVISATLAGPDGEMQLSAFAAPRSSGIWPDVRKEILSSISKQGGTGKERDGSFGPEVAAQMPSGKGQQAVRFVGIDGPRWFLRAVISGAAGGDSAKATRLEEALRQTIVDRGMEPKPVREPLSLELPKEIADQIAQQQEQQQGEQPE